MFLSLPLCCNFRRYISPSTRDEIPRNQYPLTSVNIHAFLAETAIPARLTKTRTGLYNGREKICIFINFMVYDVQTCFYNCRVLCTYFGFHFVRLFIKLRPQPCVTVPSVKYAERAVCECCDFMMTCAAEVETCSIQ